MESQQDIAALPLEDLQEEYCHLLKRYQQLLDANDANAQRIHELKRSLDTATAAEAYLAQELEQLTALANDTTTTNESKNSGKLQAELTELRRKYNNLETECALLQNNYDNALSDNAKLQQKLEHLAVQRTRTPEEMQANADEMACLQTLELQNMALLEKLQELEENSAGSTLQLAERERKIEILEDEVICLKENLQFKREELEEKTHLLESAQEQLADVNAQLAALSEAPENADRKGNSLFAEVDDQRQAMKQVLAAQKKSYTQMKKIFHESEYEIRRLKRENAAMHKEMQTCVSIFCDADKMYQKKLKARIKVLLDENEQLQRKLKLSEEQISEVAAGKGVSCIESMLKFCKRETEELKKQLRTERIEKASLEEEQRTTQQNLARWRFDALKTRCVLLDRENILNENKIVFKSEQHLNIQINKQQLETAQPRLTTHSSEKIANSSVITEQQTVKPAETTLADVSSHSTNNISLSQSLIALSICELAIAQEENKENVLPSPCIELKNDKNTPNKCLKNRDESNGNAATPLAAMKPTNSILQETDIFKEKPTKHVKFASKERQVHILSPNTANQSASSNTKQSTPLQVAQTKSSNGVVIRRFMLQKK